MDTGILSSRIAFLFLIFAVISGGYVSEVLSCQLQHLLTTSSAARHSIGFLMVFVFLMMEGGWSFDPDDDEKAPTDWSSGNTMHSLIIAAGIYAAFVLSSKMQLKANLAFYALLLTIYVINTQRRFLKDRKRISDTRDAQLKTLNKVLLGLLLAVFVYGFVDYVSYQHAQHPTDFSWSRFLIGKHTCDSAKSRRN